jgi:integral membrane sensor domain MASE1
MNIPAARPSNHSLFRRFIENRDRAFVRSLVPGDLKVIALVIFGYVLTGELSLQLARPDPGAAIVWLPAGISLAAILLRGNRVWPGVFIGAFLLNVAAGTHYALSIGIGFGSTLEALLGAYLVNKFAEGKDAFFAPQCVVDEPNDRSKEDYPLCF